MKFKGTETSISKNGGTFCTNCLPTTPCTPPPPQEKRTAHLLKNASYT